MELSASKPMRPESAEDHVLFNLKITIYRYICICMQARFPRIFHASGEDLGLPDVMEGAIRESRSAFSPF